MFEMLQPIVKRIYCRPSLLGAATFHGHNSRLDPVGPIVGVVRPRVDPQGQLDGLAGVFRQVQEVIRKRVNLGLNVIVSGLCRGLLRRDESSFGFVP